MTKRKEVYWSLFQAITWLIFQTEESVSSMGRKEHPSETHLILWQHTKNIVPYRSEDKAKQELLFVLQSGSLIAFGQKTKNDPSEEIPALHWKDLLFGFGRRGANTASLELFSSLPDWYSVAFLKEDIKRLFPSRNEKRKKTKVSNTGHIPSLTQRQHSWARQYYAELESKGIRHGRDKEFSDFRDVFPNASREMFRRLKQETVPSRCRGGRPPSNNKITSMI